MKNGCSANQWNEGKFNGKGRPEPRSYHNSKMLWNNYIFSTRAVNCAHSNNPPLMYHHRHFWGHQWKWCAAQFQWQKASEMPIWCRFMSSQWERTMRWYEKKKKKSSVPAKLFQDWFPLMLMEVTWRCVILPQITEVKFGMVALTGSRSALWPWSKP